MYSAGSHCNSIWLSFPEPAADVSGDSKLKSGGLENENSERRTSIGKLQVLRWSWDTENKRWFHLDPHDVSDRLLPGDPLHWTGIAQRWNTTCAECHSTDLHRGFDVQSGSFQTTFSEIDVSCEACHGPGSVHVAIAQRSRYKPDPNYGHGLASLKASAEHQIQSCAPCHARRSRITDNYRPGENYFDHFNESLLDPMIYFADGQYKMRTIFTVRSFKARCTTRGFAVQIATTRIRQAQGTREPSMHLLSSTSRGEV